ncbi:uncharacterized protein [Panulirus ornatus]|uniref:uncharacterized protein isoform X2 n=1 Tax=Panulirus ornatus TaxID=150431 RepID=UPI003A860648
MAGQDRLRRAELAVLQKEEVVLRELIEKYRNGLNRLQVEELTIRNQLGRIQDVELRSRNNTPLESALETHSNPANKSLLDGTLHCSSNQVMLDGLSSEMGGREITMNELQINQSTLNLDAAPLIHRMLHDSEVYEEEEDENDHDMVRILKE